MKTRTILKLFTITTLIVAATVFVSACGTSVDEDAAQVADPAEHVEHVGDAVDAGDITSADDHSDADDITGADAHSEADDHVGVEVLVSMTDELTFGPNEIVVETGQPVVLTIENVGLALHDFTIDEIAANVGHGEGGSSDSDHTGSGHDEFALHLALDGNATGTLEFTPLEAGEYEFHCTVPGHTESGMIGTLTVTGS